eukprot:jgi/Undpi1/3579/HiC_scaffold_16.g06951.m1
MRRTPGETSQEVAAASPAPSSRSPMNEKGSKATNSTTSERKKRALLSAGAGNIRRGSLTMMANQLERLEAREPEDVHRYVYASISPLFDDGRSSVRSEKDIIQPALDSTMVMGLTAVTGTAALLLAVARTADWWQEWVRLYDAYVVVGGICLTASTRWGSAVFFLRVVRVVAFPGEWLGQGKREEPVEADESPAVQLYQLVMRAVREPSSIFSVAEKKVLRNLLSLLAHQQIYVDASLQRGNAAYWKEYGHEERPRARPSIAFGALENTRSPKKIVSSAHSHCSHSPMASRMLTLAMKLGRGRGAAIESAQDEAILRVLGKVDCWDFDPFELEEVTQGHPLVTLSGYLFAVKYNFFACFDFSKEHFNNFMVEVEQGYGSGTGKEAMNIYHNRRHAADVTQAVHYFLLVCNLGQHLQDVEAVALILGSLIHDFKHPGRSNAFLTKTNNTLAVTYNDISVLENFHLSEAFLLLRKDECNFFRDVAPPMAQEIRRIMISMVLATDLKMHFDVLGEFNSHLTDIHEGELVEEGRAKTYASAMKVCIKSADISHPTRATPLHLRWTRDVIEEFFLQGDEEKSLGLEPSPLCDRHNTDIATSQKNFITFLVKPLFKSWVSFLDCPAADLCTATLQRNEEMWLTKEEMGDNSLNLVAAPVVPTPQPPLPPRNPARRPSIMRGISSKFSGGTVGSGDAVGQLA